MEGVGRVRSVESSSQLFRSGADSRGARHYNYRLVSRHREYALGQQNYQRRM